jgi:hypothetical protein
MGDRSRIYYDGDFLVVVCHALYSPWKEILNDGQLTTWAAPGTPSVIHAHGIATSRTLRKIDVRYWELKWSKRWGKVITLVELILSPLVNRSIPNVEAGQLQSGVAAVEVDMPDLNFFMNKKTLALLKYGSKRDCKHIIFTTSSSYINLKALTEILNKTPSSNIVAGRIIERNGTKFPSGSFRVFSPDVLTNVLQNLDGYRYWLPEDLALGGVLSKMNVKFLNIASLDLDSIDSIEKLSEAEILNVPHFRLKSEIQGRRIDVELMKRLHLRIKNRDDS